MNPEKQKAWDTFRALYERSAKLTQQAEQSRHIAAELDVEAGKLIKDALPHLDIFEKLNKP